MQHILTNELAGETTAQQCVTYKCTRIKLIVNMFTSEDMEIKHDYTVST